MHSSPTCADVSCHNIEAVANNSDSELAADVADCNETEVSNSEWYGFKVAGDNTNMFVLHFNVLIVKQNLSITFTLFLV